MCAQSANVFRYPKAGLSYLPGFQQAETSKWGDGCWFLLDPFQWTAIWGCSSAVPLPLTWFSLQDSQQGSSQDGVKCLSLAQYPPSRPSKASLRSLYTNPLPWQSANCHHYCPFSPTPYTWKDNKTEWTKQRDKTEGEAWLEQGRATF